VWSFSYCSSHPIARSVRETNRHGLSPFVILHSDDAGFCGRGTIFTGHRNAIGKFQRQSGQKNRVLRAAKLENAGFPQPRSPRTHGRNLHRNAHGADFRKEPRKLLGAILGSVNERRCVSLWQVTHVLNAADFPNSPGTRSSQVPDQNSRLKHHEQPRA
jgi:hypothetical protein